MEVGDKLVAQYYCGFPDGTTKGKDYEVSRVKYTYDGRVHFFIINDEGNEVFPVSTVFKKEESENGKG